MAQFNLAAKKSDFVPTAEDYQIPTQIEGYSPVEMQIISDGKVRLYCKNKQRLNAFRLTHLADIPVAKKLFRTGISFTFEATPEKILELQCLTTGSNWNRGVARTDALLSQLTNKNGEVCKPKAFKNRVKSAVKSVDQQENARILQWREARELEAIGW